MNRIDAYKILSGEQRALTCNRDTQDNAYVSYYRLENPQKNGVGEIVGYSRLEKGKEDFFITGDAYNGGKKIGHTLEDAKGIRTFFNEIGERIGQEQQDGSYLPHAPEQAFTTAIAANTGLINRLSIGC